METMPVSNPRASITRPQGIVARCGSLLGLAACLGCTDRITAPEAMRLIDALEPTVSGDTAVQRRYLGGAMGGLLWTLWTLRAPPPLTVTVLLDGQPVQYNAIVFDRNPIPPPDLSPGGKCQFAPSLTLALWRLGEVADGFYLSGQEFPAALVEQPTWCPDAMHYMPAEDSPPYLRMVRLPLDSAGGLRPGPATMWAPAGGTVDISVGEDAGNCGLTPEDSAIVYQQSAATCRRTTHQVRLRAALKRTWPEAERAVGPVSMTIELPETEVIGARYTLHCDQQPQLEVCWDRDKKIREGLGIPR